jgi:hypothetical protein
MEVRFQADLQLIWFDGSFTEIMPVPCFLFNSLLVFLQKSSLPKPNEKSANFLEKKSTNGQRDI